MEKRGGGYATISKRRFLSIFFICLFIWVLIFFPEIYKIHQTYKNSEVVSAIISDIAGCQNGQIKVTYRYEILGRNYEAVKKESPTDQKIEDNKKIRVSTIKPEEVLDYTSQGVRVLQVILFAVVTFVLLLLCIAYVSIL